MIAEYAWKTSCVRASIARLPMSFSPIWKAWTGSIALASWVKVPAASDEQLTSMFSSTSWYETQTFLAPSAAIHSRSSAPPTTAPTGLSRQVFPRSVEVETSTSANVRLET